MTEEQLLKNLHTPEGKVDIILDTDTFNEIDDQFALVYMLLTDKFNVKGICAAPFLNARSESAADGMEKSYKEILHLIDMVNCGIGHNIAYKGSREYLKDEKTPSPSPAADFMAKLADNYSPEKPLYIAVIGAITNVASAILLNPKMKENCVIVWLGGNAANLEHPAHEFNMMQDIAAARVVFGCGIPLIQLPCAGVVSELKINEEQLSAELLGHNELCDYLCNNTIEYMRLMNRPEKVIWDVTAIAWLLNGEGKYMSEKIVPAFLPQYDESYGVCENAHNIGIIEKINREAIFDDVFGKLRKHGSR